MRFDTRLKVFMFLFDMSLTLGLLIFFVPELAMLRNHVGDFLAVVCIFSFLAFPIKNTLTIALITLGISVGLEIIQATALVSQQTTLSEFFLGHTFDPIDLAIYVLTVFALAALHSRLNIPAPMAVDAKKQL